MKKNNDALASSVERVLQIRMRVLISKKDFQEKIGEVRRSFDLPPNGLGFEKERIKEFDLWYKQFSDENEKKIQEADEATKKLNAEISRQHNLYKEFTKLDRDFTVFVAHNTHRLPKLYKNKRYRAYERRWEKIKNQLNLAIIKPDYYWEQCEKILSQIPENIFNQQVDLLLWKYHLPTSFRNSIEWYIRYNEIRLPSKNYEINYEVSKVSRRVEPELMDEYSGKARIVIIRIFSPLKTKELKAMISELADFQTKVFPPGLLARIRPDTDVEKIIELSKKTEGAKEISGRPRKTELCLLESEYVRQLKKSGYSDAKIRKVMRGQVLGGERVNMKKQKIEKTSSSEVRKAKHKLKRLQREIFL